MALSRKTDGTGSANLVTSAWWNDFYDLLTGAMTDQAVTIANQLSAKGLVGLTFTTSSDDSLRLFDRAGVEGAHLGWAQNGTGFYVWDQVNGAFVIQKGTKNGLTVNGTLTVNAGLNTDGGALVTDGSGYLTLKKAGSTSASTNYLTIQNTTNAPGAFNFYIDTAGYFGIWDQGRSRNVLLETNGGYLQASYNGTSVFLAAMRSNGGGAAGKHIWVGTTDPGANAQEGDIWIAA